MPATPTAPIAIYGATGYTGRLVAAELAASGCEFVLAGRDAAKLEALAGEVGGSPAIAVAALDDPVALRGALEPCAAVIACAGPFRLHGEPVVRAAVESSTHYVDTTGEQGFMATVFDRYGESAERAGVALVTGMGFDYVPGDMIGALTAEGLGPLDELVFAYSTESFGPSRGTTTTALGQMAGDDFEWRAGARRPASRKVNRGSFEFPAPIGERRMIRYPAGEHVTVPRHVETLAVRTLLTADSAMPDPRLAPLAPVIAPAVQLALRTPARRAIEAAVARLPDGPETGVRRAARYTIVCDAIRGGRRRRGVISGSDVYGVTARATAEAATRMAAPGYERRGALAPSQAFDPREFLAALADFDVRWEVEDGW